MQESYITIHSETERDIIIRKSEKTNGIYVEQYGASKIKVIF